MTLGIGAPVSAHGTCGMGEYDATHQLPIVPCAPGPSSERTPACYTLCGQRLLSTPQRSSSLH